MRQQAKKASKPRDLLAVRAPRQRSKVTNGRRAFVEGDGQSPWARRWRDLAANHANDLAGAAGLGALSQAQQSLIRRVATISIELEQMEGRLSKGEPVDLDTYGRGAGNLRRLLETLGIERKAKDVSPPTIEAYLAHANRQAAAA
jgi:hypothetical protein